jgi:centractin
MDSFSDVLTRNPIVIDNGSGSIKAGFVGEEKPRIIFPSLYLYLEYFYSVGRPKYKAVLPTAN